MLVIASVSLVVASVPSGASSGGVPNPGNAQPALAGRGCLQAQRGADHRPEQGQAWPVNGDTWRILIIWSPASAFSGERKLLLAPGEHPTLLASGAIWHWPAACGAAAQR